jgi:hypothetical protein
MARAVKLHPSIQPPAALVGHSAAQADTDSEAPATGAPIEKAQHPAPGILEVWEQHAHDPLGNLAFWAMAKTFQG